MSKKSEKTKPEEERGLDEAALAQLTWSRFTRAVEPHDKWVVDAEKFDEFFNGKQWNDTDLQKLKDEGRPALTINLTKPAVLTICGEQQMTRAEVTLKPRNGRADAETAKLLAQVHQYVDYDTNYSAIEAAMFFDGIVTDRGFLDTRISYEKNRHGDVSITHDNPRLIVLDPDCKTYDPDKWPGVFETYWESLANLEATYGQKVADSLRASTLFDIDYASESLSIKWSDGRIAQLAPNVTPEHSLVRHEGIDRYIEGIRVIEHQFFVVRPDAIVFVDPVTGDITDPRCDLTEEELAPLAAARGLQMVRMPRRRVRWHVVARNKVLAQEWSPYPFLTKAGYFPTYRNGLPTGIVRDMVGPQEQLNKIESQELHVINSSANGGWMYEEGSVVNMNDDEFAEKGAQTGLNIKVRKGASFKPEKIRSNEIPQGLTNKAAKNVQYMRFISMVNDAMLGVSSPEVSGVAIEQKKQSGIAAFVPAFANLQRTREIVAKRVLWMIQNFYTEPRLLRITDYSKPERPEVEVGINIPDDATSEILNNVSLGRYDVVVSSVPARDTQDEGQFAQMVQMREAGITLPDDEVIRRSNLVDKFPLADRVAEMMGYGEPSEEEVAFQQMQMQLEQARAEAEIAKIQAAALELQSRGELNLAKAESLRMQAATADAERQALLIEAAVERERMASDLQQTREKLEARLAEVRETLAAKVAIAQMQVGVKREGMLHTSAIRRAEEAGKLAEQTRRERVQNAQLAFKAALQKDAQREKKKQEAKAKKGGKQPPGKKKA